MINLCKSRSNKTFINVILRTLLVFISVFISVVAHAVGLVQSGTALSTGALFTVNYTYQDNTCPGEAAGTITINTISGNSSSGYNFRWLDNATELTNTRQNLPGTVQYEVEITDRSNPLIRDNVRITISSPISANPITESEKIIEKANVCIPDSANGSVKIKVTGGALPYTSFQFSMMDPSTGMPVALAPSPIDPNFPDVAINNSLLPGTYFLTVTDQNSCPSVLPPFTILRNNCDPANDKIGADPSMSPNDDGQGNNFFYINKIEDYPENEVIIYNRWGMEVFTMLGYDNKDRVFRGVANSKLTNRNIALVDGVYYYTIRTVMDKKQKVNKGYIIMKR